MNLDDWVDLIKHEFGPNEFKSIAIQFLREYYSGAVVLYSDGPGDGGVDAWVVVSATPPLRMAAQFHAGKAVQWDHKLEDDLKTLRAFRESLASDDPRRIELLRLLFVCTQTPQGTREAEVISRMQKEYGVTVQVFDARAIASLALQNRAQLLSLLAQRLPGAKDAEERKLPSAREELLLSFAFFHQDPAKYRLAVAKSSLATVLHRNNGKIEKPRLISEAAGLLRLPSSSRLLTRALRDLASEQNVTIDEDRVLVSPSLSDRTITALTIAKAEEEAMRKECVGALDSFLPKGVHHRVERAHRAVDAVFGDLGLLVRAGVPKRALTAVERDVRAIRRADDDDRRRWDSIGRKLATELDLDNDALTRALSSLVRAAAKSPFSRNLTAAELFLQLTEYEPDELPAVLAPTSPLCVVLDTSVAMPMLCALYDRPAQDWETSVAAHSLYNALRCRGVRMLIPTVYVEEIASHLRKAWEFEGIIASDASLERSGNFFVAHYCSTRSGNERSAAEFSDFLAAFGAVRQATGQLQQLIKRRQVEQEVCRILGRYGIDVEAIGVQTDDPTLADEPVRDSRLIQHERAVVRWLQINHRLNPLLCTADRWLQGVLAVLGITALDSAALTDLLDLVRHTTTSSGLLSPLAIAQTLSEEERTLAAAVWDRIVALETHGLADWKLLSIAQEFHKQWFTTHRDLSSLSTEWIAFRDAGMSS